MFCLKFNTDSTTRTGDAVQKETSGKENKPMHVHNTTGEVGAETYDMFKITPKTGRNAGALRYVANHSD